ncbi:MAG: cytochrome c oxidase subunit 3, partial [Bacteroidota bacterium]|nr:cytochrome c oxidase subunit 3 [Bacteroidota bacterium]
ALGITFVFLQYLGFIQLWHNGFTLTRNVSFSFLYVIVGLHAIHVLGGVVAMAVMVIRAFSVRRKSYSQVPVDMMNTYWHFVDLLWIYLWIFLYMIR